MQKVGAIGSVAFGKSTITVPSPMWGLERSVCGISYPVSLIAHIAKDISPIYHR
jgi:hypothetical protein